MVFPVVMYECDSWTIKKAECQIIDAFEWWCWRRLLRAPWVVKRSNQSKGNLSWIFIGGTDAEDLGLLMQRTDSLEKTLMLGKIEGGGKGDNRGSDGWMASLTLWTWICVGSESWWWTGKPGVLQSMESQRIRHNWETELNVQQLYVLILSRNPLIKGKF